MASGAVLALGIGLGGTTRAAAGISCPTEGDADPFLVEDITDSGSEGSFRCAVFQANQTPGADTITFASGVTGTIQLTNDEVQVYDDVDIQGPGADVVTISGEHYDDDIAVFNADGRASNVTISGLTLTHPEEEGGRGLYAEDTNLTLEDMVITGNSVIGGEAGAGVYIEERDYGSSLTIVDSTISGNDAEDDAGGIYADDTTVVLQNVSLADNTAGDYAGGLLFTSGDGADLTITSSTITGNDAAAGTDKYGAGGGIAAFAGDSSAITIDGTTVSGNSASTYGGGIAIEIDAGNNSVNAAAADGGITITNSTISGNAVAQPDSKYFGFALGGGIAIDTTETALISGSTISGNTVNAEVGEFGGFAAGGGIGAEGQVDIVNSTISGNTAGLADAEGYDAASGFGGGVYASGSQTTLRHSTVTGNASDDGGGLGLDYGAAVTHTIVAGNTAATGPDVLSENEPVLTAQRQQQLNPRQDAGEPTMDFSGPAAAPGDATAQQAGPGLHATWSLIGDTTDAGLESPATNVLDVNALLGPLSDNGGTTETHLLLVGSPAINAGDPAFAPPPNTDQRGAPRVVEGRIDIGAVEAAARGCPANPTDNQRFVCEVYIDALGREAEEAGLLYWVDLLDDGASRGIIASGLFGTTEYRSIVITSIFQELLGRAPDPAGLSFFLSALAGGASIEDVESSVAASSEYFGLAGGTNADWLDAVYADLLGRPIDAAGSSHWLGQLAGGVSRATVAKAIASSSEAHGVVVVTTYNQYLDRDPDPAGFAWAVDLLDSGASRELFTAVILNSTEYLALADGEPDG